MEARNAEKIAKAVLVTMLAVVTVALIVFFFYQAATVLGKQ